MKNAHRKTHLITWIVLLPALVFVLTLAIAARPANQPVIESSADVERGGLLP